MIIDKLTLRNFRNYEETVLTPHEGVNLFFGANGSGKTNLLEAVHYCALGKSHRITGDQSAVRIGESFAVCGVSVTTGGVRREITVRLVPNELNKKVILVDQKPIRRFSDMMGCLQCVIFSPEDLGLIREGPSMRRRYLDMMISQVNRGYFIALQQYRSGLEQRNALLKNMRATGQNNAGMLDVFEQAMAAHAAVIVAARKKVIAMLAELAADTYRGISGRDGEEFQASYHSAFRDSENVEEDFMRILKEDREEDLRLGITSDGPHRDDLNLSLNKKNMKVYASQGQIRTAALSLKLAQMKALRAGRRHERTRQGTPHAPREGDQRLPDFHHLHRRERPGTGGRPPRLPCFQPGRYCHPGRNEQGNHPGSPAPFRTGLHVNCFT